MAIIKNWGYGETIVRPNENRRDARYVGRMSMASFIRTVLQGKSGAQWVRDRMTDTGNDFELSLIERHPNKVVLYDNRTKEILEILEK